MDTMIKKTAWREKKEKRDAKIHQEYTQAIAEGSMPMAVIEQIMKKYGLHAYSSVYRILNKFQDGK
jgi:hypothetical protein